MRFSSIMVLTGLFLVNILSASAQDATTLETAEGKSSSEAQNSQKKSPTTRKMTAEQREFIEFARDFMKTYKPQTGKILLKSSIFTQNKPPIAALNVPKGFYYLNPKDSEKVLTKIWGNPPGNNVLGMIFPDDVSLFGQDIWGVTITYKEDGYVSDKEAENINYDEMLAQMKKSVHESNERRKALGYDSIELVGWAAKPYYDKTTHKMHWAKELSFNGNENTLNYNIRVLGRKGVLVLNFVAGMNQKPLIEKKLDTVLAMANFEQGNRYEDFTPGLDKVATYGIGALIAGKVIAKTGMLAALGIFFLKFAKIFMIAGVALLAGIGKLFSRN